MEVHQLHLTADNVTHWVGNNTINVNVSLGGDALPAQMFFYPAAPVLSSQPGSMEYLGDPNMSDVVNITRGFDSLTSPLAVTIAVLLVFLFSPMILIGNSLVLIAIYRFKRLRTPSNYLIMSLASSDLGIGMFMPVGMYLELGAAAHHQRYGDRICLLSYGVAISLCSVSVLVMVAIAVDRFTSLARPLRYNNLITHTAVERYIAVFWAYGSLVGFTPLGYSLVYGSETSHGGSPTTSGSTGGPSSYIPSSSAEHDCSFGALVSKPVQLFMFCAVYGPSALVLVFCYGYIYVIARGHARAISGVRHSFHYHHNHPQRNNSQHSQHDGNGNTQQQNKTKDTTITVNGKECNTINNSPAVGNGTLIAASHSTEFTNRSNRREGRGGGSLREGGVTGKEERVECNGSGNTSSGNNNGHHVAGPPRYGLALAITTGMFLVLWVPFQACMLMDVFLGTSILRNWVAVYLALPILASSAFNPWVYGYRNAELRAAVRRVVDDLLTALGFTYRSHQVSDPIAPSAIATAGDPGSHLLALPSQQQRLLHPQSHLKLPLCGAPAAAHCYSCRGGSPATVTGGEFLLVPIARPESSGVLSEGDVSKVIWPDLWPPTSTNIALTAHPGHAHSAVLITTELLPRLVLKSSRSMVESFVVNRSCGGSLGDVLIIKRGDEQQAVNVLSCSSAV